MNDGRNGRNGRDGRNGVHGENGVVSKSRAPIYVTVVAVLGILSSLGISGGSWRDMSNDLRDQNGTIRAQQVQIDQVVKDVEACKAVEKELADKVAELTSQLTRLNTILEGMEKQEARRRPAT